jgi:hypothetical protein
MNMKAGDWPARSPRGDHVLTRVKPAPLHLAPTPTANPRAKIQNLQQDLIGCLDRVRSPVQWNIFPGAYVERFLARVAANRAFSKQQKAKQSTPVDNGREPKMR